MARKRSRDSSGHAKRSRTGCLTQSTDSGEDPRMRRWSILVLLAVVGCAGNTSALSSQEQNTIGQAQADVIIYGVTGAKADREAAQDGVADIIRVARAKPGVKVDKRTIEQMMQDLASQVDPVDPDMAAELDRALGS